MAGRAAEAAANAGPTLLPKLAPGAPPPGDGHDPAALADRLGGGRPLDPEVGAEFGGVLGRELSQVRVHDDAAGARSRARSAHARSRSASTSRSRPASTGPARRSAMRCWRTSSRTSASRRTRAPPRSLQSGGGDTSLERDADTLAAGAVAGLWGGVCGGPRSPARRSAPALGAPAAELQRRRHQGPRRRARPARARPPPFPPRAGPTSTRAPAYPTRPPSATSSTSSTRARSIPPRRSRPAPRRRRRFAALGRRHRATPPPATARPAARPHAAHRRAPQRRDARHPRESRRPRLPIASFEGPGRGAKTTVDAVFGHLKAAAALSAAARHGVTFTASGAGRNLFDANDPADRAASGAPIERPLGRVLDGDPRPRGVGHAQTHHFDPERPAASRRTSCATRSSRRSSARKADLELYDLWGFALAPDGAGVGRTVATPTTLNAGLSTRRGRRRALAGRARHALERLADARARVHPHARAPGLGRGDLGAAAAS